jgi:hypothetical protein
VLRAALTGPDVSHQSRPHTEGSSKCIPGCIYDRKGSAEAGLTQEAAAGACEAAMQGHKKAQTIGACQELEYVPTHACQEHTCCMK